MAVTTLETASAIQKPDTRPRSRCALPVKVLGITNGALLALVVTAIAMPEMTSELFDTIGVPAASLLRTVDFREPVYMAFALVWSLAIVYMHVDEVNEHRLALRSAPETEIIRAFTIEDLIGHVVRVALLLLPACGLYFLPSYLHNAEPLDHVVFIITFAAQFLLWKVSRRE